MQRNNNWLKHSKSRLVKPYIRNHIFITAGVIVSALSGTIPIDKANADPSIAEYSEHNHSIKTMPQYLYAVDAGRNAVYQFKVGANGALDPLPQSALATGNTPYAIVVTPNSQFVYVANRNGKSISQYTVGIDGSLSYANPLTISTGNFPVALAVEPTGRVLYVACSSTNALLQFHIQVDGTLTPLASGRITLKQEPSAMVIGAKGKFAFVSYRRTNNIDQFRIQPDGMLTPQFTGATCLSPVLSVIVPKRSRYVYAILRDHSAVQFQETDEGKLLKSITLLTMDEVPASLVFDDQARFAYAVNSRSSTISQYQVDVKGILVPLKPNSISTTDKPIMVSSPTTKPIYVDKSTNPTSLVLDNYGTCAYVGNGDGSISFYHINVDGTLSFESPVNNKIGKSLVSLIIVTNHNLPIRAVSTVK